MNYKYKYLKYKKKYLDLKKEIKQQGGVGVDPEEYLRQMYAQDKIRAKQNSKTTIRSNNIWIFCGHGLGGSEYDLYPECSDNVYFSNVNSTISCSDDSAEIIYSICSNEGVIPENKSLKKLSEIVGNNRTRFYGEIGQGLSDGQGGELLQGLYRCSRDSANIYNMSGIYSITEICQFANQNGRRNGEPIIILACPENAFNNVDIEHRMNLPLYNTEFLVSKG